MPLRKNEITKHLGLGFHAVLGDGERGFTWSGGQGKRLVGGALSEVELRADGRIAAQMQNFMH